MRRRCGIAVLRRHRHYRPASPLSRDDVEREAEQPSDALRIGWKIGVPRATSRFLNSPLARAHLVQSEENRIEWPRQTAA